MPARDTNQLLQERGSTYGDPEVNLECAKEIKNLAEFYRSGNRDVCTEAHHEAIDMCLTKICRIITGPKLHLDNYDDLIGYASIARALAEKELNNDK